MSWRVDDGAALVIDVAAEAVGGGVACDVVAGTCLSAAVGISADRPAPAPGTGAHRAA